MVALRLNFVQRAFGFDLGTSIGGTVSPKTLKLNLPAQNGGFNVIIFAASTVTKFNAAVSVLQGAVEKCAQIAYAALKTREEQRAREQRLVSQERGIREANDALRNNFDALNALRSELLSGLETLKQRQTDLLEGLAELYAAVESYEVDGLHLQIAITATRSKAPVPMVLDQQWHIEVGNTQTYAVELASNALERILDRYVDLPKKFANPHFH